jgi:hypothetical protein
MHYITDQHPEHPGETWLCDMATGRAIRHLPNVTMWSFALTADGAPGPATLSTGVAAALIAAGDFEPFLSAAVGDMTPWEGTLAFVNQPTDDRRQLDSGGGSFRSFPIPLMAQMATSYGHDGAWIVGRVDSGVISDTEVTGAGVFDSGEWGMDAARLVDQQMLDRVSIDLGALEVETEVTETDDDGFPTAWIDHFTSWQIAAVTQVNVSAFAESRIHLTGPLASDGEVDGGDGAAEPVAAAATPARALAIPTAAPSEWFSIAEPAPGEQFALGGIGAEWLVEQDDAGALAMPLQIMDDGRVMGHIAYWGQCHVGFPGRCVTPPTGDGAYSRFHVGYHVTDEGESIATGVLTSGCDHAATSMRAPEALSHYAHNGVGWADVRVINGVYGPWACGVLRPDVTPEQIRVLRAGALSGDWRTVSGRLEMIATLAVNTPGFPIARESVTAAALAWFDEARARARTDESGEVVSLVAAGQVHRCFACEERKRSGEPSPRDLSRRMDRLERAMMPELLASAEAARQRIG